MLSPLKFREKALNDKLDAILALLKVQNARQGMTKYMSEEDVMPVTG